jgi:hypothetical protein
MFFHFSEVYYIQPLRDGDMMYCFSCVYYTLLGKAAREEWRLENASSRAPPGFAS